MRFDEIHPFARYVRFLEIQSTEQYPLYRPYDARLFYSYKGRGTIFADGKTYPMEQGALLLIAPGVEYQLLTPEDQVRYLAVNFDYTYENAGFEVPVAPAYAQTFSEEYLLNRETISDFPLFNSVIYLKNMKEIESRLLKMEEEYKRKLLFFRSKLSAFLTEVLTSCAREVNSQTYHLEKSAGKMKEINSFIHENYAKPLSNREIGEKFCFHPNYVNSMMTAYTGMSLHRYLLYIRIANAIELLETTAMSVTEVASRVGFEDLCYFSKYFRKITGVSPREYRAALEKPMR